MKIRRIKVVNFRALESVELTVQGAPTAIVVAGPNAVGKSTVLDAVRLTKALLAPTFRGEPEMTLRDMGLMSPHDASLDRSQLFRDQAQDLRVHLAFEPDTQELDFLERSLDEWSLRRIGNRLGARAENVQLELVQFLSSPEGRQMRDEVRRSLQADLQRLRGAPTINLDLTITPDGRISGSDIFHNESISLLSGRTSGRQALISHFPADRAMPGGEVTIQLGTQEVAAQLHSHTAQSAGKYGRLKQYLVNRFLEGEAARADLRGDFSRIFDKLLRDKELAEIHVSPQGRLSIAIREKVSGVTYDIDRMSSGEKGLLLTLLLIKRTLLPGGIVLLDEPELHLNAAVCRDLLPFMIGEVSAGSRGQIVLCTHSEEILASAYGRADSNLFHLRASRNLSRIEAKDRDEAEVALRTLGASSLDVLFSEGTLFVEGPSDRAILEHAYQQELSRWKIVALEGRNEVAKKIKDLLKLSQEGKLEGIHSFLFDHDRKPADLDGSGSVRVCQLDRYCIENYLLDADSIHDALKEIEKRDPSKELSRGNVADLLERFALEQVRVESIREAFRPHDLPNISIQRGELAGMSAKDPADLAKLLYQRLDAVRASLATLSESEWTAAFAENLLSTRASMETQWRSEWRTRASGKLILDSLHAHYAIPVSKERFRTRLAQIVRQRNPADWVALDSAVRPLFEKISANG